MILEVKMNIRQLNKDFSINAYWTVDGIDYEFGILKYTQDRIIVELPDSKIEFDSDYPKITGYNNRNQFSLFNIIVKKSANKELSMVQLQAEYMFIDKKYIPDMYDFKINSITWTTDRLPLLLSDTPWESLEDERGIKYREVPVEEYNIESLKASIIIRYSHSSNSNITPEEGLTDTFKSRPYLTLRYEEKKSILDIRKDVQKITNLITVITGSPQTIQAFNYPSTTKDLVGNELPQNGEFYFIQSIPSRKNLQNNSAYDFEKLSGHFGTILSVYFEKFENIANISIHILLMTSAKNMLEASYIDVVTSLEAYHRDFYNYEITYSVATENMIMQIDNLIKESSESKNRKQRDEYYKIFYNIMTMRNPILQERIADLLKKLPDPLKNIILFSGVDFTNEKDTNRFSERIAVSRNYLAHGNRTESIKKLTSSEMINATYILTIISEYFLMSRLGLQDEIIVEGIRHKKIYQRFLTNLYDFEQPFINE